MKTATWILVSALAGAAGLVSPFAVSVASAQDADAPDVATAGEKKRVLIGKIGGAKPSSVRGWLSEGLAGDPGLEIVPEDASGALAADASESDVAAAGRQTGADVVILGSSKLGKKWTATLSVHDGRTGALIEKVEVTGVSFGAYETALKEGAELKGPIAGAAGWPRPAPEPVLEEEVAPPPEPEKPAEPVKESKGRPSPLSARLGFGINARAFRYSDTLEDLFPDQGFAEPASYTQDASPSPHVEVLWFPAAHFTEKWPAHIGISGGYSMVLGVSPTTVLVSPDGLQRAEQPLEQSQSRWFVGLEGRIPVGPLRFLVDGRFAQQSFTLSGDDVALGNDGVIVPGPAQLPDVAYQTIGVGADIEWRPEQLIFGGHARYLITLDTGNLGSSEWYPNTSVVAFEVGIRAGWALSKMFDILVGVDSQLYGMNFNPIDPAVTPEEKVAGGASDRYLNVWLGLGFNLPGDSKDDASAASGGAGSGSSGDIDSFD